MHIQKYIVNGSPDYFPSVKEQKLFRGCQVFLSCMEENTECNGANTVRGDIVLIKGHKILIFY